jgi:DNA-binding transcriptional MerR regulator
MNDTSTAEKYHFILYLRDKGLSWEEITSQLNTMGIKTIKKKRWKKSSARKFITRQAGTSEPEGFDPIEYERIGMELAKLREQMFIERMILQIKRRVTFD